MRGRLGVLRLGKVEVSGGFLLLMAFLFYLDRNGLLLWAWLACLLHELGHYGAIRLVGGQVRRLHLTAVGAEMELASQYGLSYGRELAAVLAGPGASLLAAWMAAQLGRVLDWPAFFLFSGLNLCTGLFQLLPVRPMDGGRALELLLSALWREEWADLVCNFCSAVVVFLLLLVGAILWGGGIGGFSLTVTVLWLAAGLRKGRKRGKSGRFL